MHEDHDVRRQIRQKDILSAEDLSILGDFPTKGADGGEDLGRGNR
jgi:hypothetical protein